MFIGYNYVLFSLKSFVQLVIPHRAPIINLFWTILASVIILCGTLIYIELHNSQKVLVNSWHVKYSTKKWREESTNVMIPYSSWISDQINFCLVILAFIHGWFPPRQQRYYNSLYSTVNWFNFDCILTATCYNISSLCSIPLNSTLPSYSHRNVLMQMCTDSSPYQQLQTRQVCMKYNFIMI